MEFYSESNKIELSDMKLFKKKKIVVHMIESCCVANKGDIIILETIEGKVNLKADEEMFIMIGPREDVYPIPKVLFESKYICVEPIINDNLLEVIRRNKWVLNKVKTCRLKRESLIYAKQMDSDFAVYVKHCDSVIYGKKGDYYAVTYEDTENAYIISNSLMQETYEPIR